MAHTGRWASSYRRIAALCALRSDRPSPPPPSDEVVGHLALAGEQAEPTARCGGWVPILQRRDAHHRPAGLADQERRSSRRLLHQARQVGFGLVHVGLSHVGPSVSNQLKTTHLHPGSEERWLPGGGLARPASCGRATSPSEGALGAGSPHSGSAKAIMIESANESFPPQ
jgi:hypothetical protein